MRKAEVYQLGILAGVLEEVASQKWRFSYRAEYTGAPVSLTMPIGVQVYEFEGFPPCFEGVLPEGIQLEAMLRRCKLDRTDYFGQLVAVGDDLVGALKVVEIKPENPQ